MIELINLVNPAYYTADCRYSQRGAGVGASHSKPVRLLLRSIVSRNLSNLGIHRKVGGCSHAHSPHQHGWLYFYLIHYIDIKMSFNIKVFQTGTYIWTIYQGNISVSYINMIIWYTTVWILNFSWLYLIEFCSCAQSHAILVKFVRIRAR